MHNAQSSDSAEIDAVADFDAIPEVDGLALSNPYAELARAARVARSDKWGGFLALLRHDDVRAAAADTDRFTSVQGVALPPFGASAARRPPLESDPPEHAAYRAVLSSFFAPRRMRRFEPVVREIAQQYVRAAVERGSVDAVPDVTFPFPADVLCAFVGFPREDAPFLKQVSHDLVIAGREGRDADRRRLNQDIEDYVRAAVQQRLDEPDAWDESDLITALLTTPVNGTLLPVEGVIGTVRLVFFAGHGTTSNSLGSAIYQLASDPELQRMLRESPERIPDAVEEVVRLWSPARMMSRTATEAAEVAGVPLAAGDKIALVWTSANRDPAVFERPDDFDVDRSPNPHLGFGSGIHTCAGAPLARLELRVALEEILALTDDIRLDGDVRWSTLTSTGPTTLPVTFVPATQPRPRTRTRSTTGEPDIPVKVVSRRAAAQSVTEITLERADGEPFQVWTPGAHIDVVLPGLTRQYSVVNTAADPRRITIAVLEEEHGRGGSQRITREVQNGSVLSVRGPRNNFEYKPATRSVFIAGGIGITPLMSMAAMAAEHGADWTLVYLGRSRATMAFTEAIEQMGERAVIWTSTDRGRYNLDGLFADLDPATEVYACGPETLLARIEELARAVGARYHTERFQPKPLNTADGAQESFSLRLAASGIELTISPEQTILEACERAGVRIANSCRQGTCGSCEIPVLDGVPAHRDSVLSPEDQERSEYIITCVSRSRTPRLTLDL